MRKLRKCPLFVSLMMVVFFSALIGIFVGSWLLVVSQFFYSSSKVITASEKHAGVKMFGLADVDFINFALMIIGVLVIVLSVVLLWTAAEIYLLVLEKGQLLTCTEKYKNRIEREWSAAAMFQRGITRNN